MGSRSTLALGLRMPWLSYQENFTLELQERGYHPFGSIFISYMNPGFPTGDQILLSMESEPIVYSPIL
jgi:hypothetical protein